MPQDSELHPPSNFDDANAKIDALFGGDEASPSPAPDPAPTPAPAPAAPVAAPAPAPAPAPAAAPDKPQAPDLFDGDVPKRQTPKPPEASPQKPSAPDEFKTPKELREAYKTTAEERDRLRLEIAEHKKQIETARRDGETQAEARLRKELDALKKEKEELDTRVRYTDYTKSEEYKTKFIRPLQDAWKSVLGELEGVKISTEDGDVDANESHMMQLLQLPTVAAARKAAEWFGPAASEMMQHRRNILTLTQARDAAVNEWKTKGSELSERQQREAEERHRSTLGMYDEHVKTLRETAPDLFTAGDDATAKGYFEKGQQIVNLAFRGEGLEDGLTPQQKSQAIVKAQANVAAKAAAFGVVIHRLNKAQDEIEALKQQLAEYRKTEPGAGDKRPANETGKNQFSKPEDAIDAMEFRP